MISADAILSQLKAKLDSMTPEERDEYLRSLGFDLERVKKPTIVTFSGQAQHGKTSSAEILQRLLINSGQRVIVMHYADYLKHIAAKYYGWNGLKDEVGRTLLMWLGTDKIRGKFPTFWVDNTITLCKAIGEDYDYVLIGDARFPDEVARFKEEGYNVITVHVNRPDFDNGLTEKQKQHSSETAMEGFPFDYYLSATNLDTLQHELAAKVMFLGLSKGKA